MNNLTRFYVDSGVFIFPGSEYDADTAENGGEYGEDEENPEGHPDGTADA